MEKYLVDLFATAAQEQGQAPLWIVRLYLSLFNVPLGKTLRVDMVKHLLHGQNLQGKRVLDVGCGVGDLSFILAKSVFLMWAVALATSRSYWLIVVPM